MLFHSVKGLQDFPNNLCFLNVWFLSCLVIHPLVRLQFHFFFCPKKSESLRMKMPLWYYLGRATSESHFWHFLDLFLVCCFPPEMRNFLPKSKHGSPEVSVSLLGSSQSYRQEYHFIGNRMTMWIICWHLKLVHRCGCKHCYMTLYITLPIHILREIIFSLIKHIIFCKYRKVYDLNLYKEKTPLHFWF